LAAVWLCLFFWQDKTENIPEKKLQQRLTVTRWLFYPIQWFLFLVQFWVFVRILSFDYLGTSVREIFVGKDWHLWRFLHSDLFLAFGNFYFNNKQDPNLFPKGGFIFILFILLMVFFGFRVFYRNKPADENNESKETGKENNESKALTIISTFCLLGVLFYFSIVSFARHIYPYIPAVKGGGDYTLSHPVQLTFDARFTNSIPPKVNEGLQTNRLSLILLDANSSFVFLADTNDADGPKKWRSSTKKPTVYEIRREAIISITHLNPTNSNN
jgi:hypothetical protein